jgi:gamma-glutamyltranspeptidase
LLETLNILEGFDLAALGDRTPASMHLILEAFRRAFNDRTSFLGDPDFQSMPTRQLIDKNYAAAWRKSISMTRRLPPVPSSGRRALFRACRGIEADDSLFRARPGGECSVCYVYPE